MPMFQDPSRIIKNHHDYSIVSPRIYKNHPDISQVVVIRGKKRIIWLGIEADNYRLCKIRYEPWHNWVQNNRGLSGQESGQCDCGLKLMWYVYMYYVYS
jgi:hypothetical protein